MLHVSKVPLKLSNYITVSGDLEHAFLDQDLRPEL